MTMAKKKKPLSDVAKTMKKGAFRAWCKKQGHSKVTKECIAKGKRSKNPTTRRRATLAATFAKYRKHGYGGQLDRHAAGGGLAAELAIDLVSMLAKKGFANFDAAKGDVSRIGQMTELYADGGMLDGGAANAKVVDGPSHEDGGVPVTPNGTPAPMAADEVEGGEVIAPVVLAGKKVNYVFSNRLGVGHKTFAQMAKEVIDRFDNPDDRLKLNAANIELRRIARMNEGMKMALAAQQKLQQQAMQQQTMQQQGPQQFADGGILDPTNPLERAAKERLNLSVPNFLPEGRKPGLPPTTAELSAPFGNPDTGRFPLAREAASIFAGKDLPPIGSGPAFTAQQPAGMASVQEYEKSPLKRGMETALSLLQKGGQAAIKGVGKAADAVKQRYEDNPTRLASDSAALRYLAEAAMLIPKARREVPRTNPYAGDVMRKLEEARVGYDALKQDVARQAQAAYLAGRGQRSTSARMAMNASTTASAISGLSEGVMKGEQINARSALTAAGTLSQMGAYDQNALLEYDKRMAANQAQRRNMLRSLLGDMNMTAADMAQKAMERRMAVASLAAIGMANPAVSTDLSQWADYLGGRTDQVPTFGLDAEALRRLSQRRDPLVD